MTISLFLSSASAQTVTYTNAGIYTNVVPTGAGWMQVKLWGAGGGNGAAAAGGGGAFASSTLFVSPGETFVTVVGQRGATGNTSLGGAGSGNTQGGAPGFLGDYNGRGQGGQASSAFQLTNDLFVTKAVAGAGGGAGLFESGGGGGQAGLNYNSATGGQPGNNGTGGAGGGTNGNAGGNYASAATTTGISALNQANGNGGDAANWSGGGGGGYGGGGGGGGGNPNSGHGAGGGGGGSYGDVTVPGNGTQPGNSSDASYVAGTAGNAQDGLAVVTFASVGTLSATNIQVSEATLVGVVNDGGLTSSYYFDYGTTTNYGNNSAVGTLLPGAGTVIVSETISNLFPDTLYHCRIVLSNANGIFVGSDTFFTTVTAIYTPSATNIQLSEATLQGVINDPGLTSSYYFNYGTTTNYGNNSAVGILSPGAGTVIVSETISNLFPGTLYHFRIVLSNAIGIFVSSNAFFTTLLTTYTYQSAGVYTNVAPVGAAKGVFKLWGAGGGSGQGANGGGGAFSTITLAAQAGDTYVLVVGQRGAISANSLGGAGTGNTEGGDPGFLGDYSNRGQGGQASSVFFLSNNLIMKAVAGAGGGAGIDTSFPSGIGGDGGAGGVAGQNGSTGVAGQPGANGNGGSGGGGTGGNYDASATTTGISALNQAGGNGGDANNWSGGGGGGYGGGGGGGGGSNGSGGGGGGGGSYGTTIMTGSGLTPGNTSDVNYIANSGRGGTSGSHGNDGLVVVSWIPAFPPAPVLANSTYLPDGSFRFSFTNITGATFTALAVTNLPASNNWTVLGPVSEIAAGLFQYTDTQATNYPQRFYQVRSP